MKVKFDLMGEEHVVSQLRHVILLKLSYGLTVKADNNQSICCITKVIFDFFLILTLSGL